MVSQASQGFAFACTYRRSNIWTQVTDENNQPTSITYNDPYFWRPASENFPDGGQTSWTYNSPTSITTTTKMTSTQNIVRTVLLDGLGRTSQTQLNSDPQGVVKTDTTYDALGRVASVWNPYRSSSDSTYGHTSYVYDALDRICVIIPPDGTTVSGNSCPTTQPTNDIFITYSGNTATVTDQAGKKRQSATDALGRLTQHTEDPGGLGYLTTYGYDPLGNLTSVLQNSSRQRTFTYDWLSRLTSASNPESGAVTYTYDASPYSGDLTSRVAPLPNQTGSATVTTTHTYDLLHRLKSKTYSDGTTPTATYNYDETAPWGWPLSNPIGRKTTEYVSNASGNLAGAIFSYDTLGRVIHTGECTPLNCAGVSFGVDYTYDLSGNPASERNSAGVTISYAYDAAGRPTTITSNLVDAQHPATLFTANSSIGYFPNGALRKGLLGNGLTLTNAYNNRLQPCRINWNSTATALGTCTDAVPSGNLQDFNYSFNLGSSNNGNVMSWSATGQRSFNRTYGYDALNRASTLSSPSDPSGCTGLSWTYDAWANRTDQTVTGGTCYTFHQSVNTKNQLIGPYQYDAAGNMTNDGSHTYTYDAENRLIRVDGSTASYLYDAEGRRVRKTLSGVNTEYVYNLYGNVIAEYAPGCGSTCWTVGYIYLGNSLIAQYKNAVTYFAHTDHGGSTRLLTGVDRAVVQNLDYLPFGDLNSSDSGITTHKFTGDEHDAETNLDHTWFRQYSSASGRWMTPDPLSLGAADLSNPQSLNLYSYVVNSPVNRIDLLGLDWACVEINVAGASGRECTWFEDKCTGLTCGGGAPVSPGPDPRSGDSGNTSGNSTGGPQSQHPPETYADCVKNDSNYFSLQNGLSAITGGRLGSGPVAGALLGNPIAGGIQLLQDVASLKGRSAIGGGLQLGAGDIASAIAKYVPNIAFSVLAVGTAGIQTSTMQASGGFAAEISGVLPLGTLARAGTGALSVFTRTITLPISGSASLFSAAVCGIGR